MIAKAGFDDVEVFDHQPVGVDDVARYPLFTDEVLEVMRKHIPADRQHQVATRIVARATRPARLPGS